MLFLKSGTKRPLTENENAAMVTAQQFINIKDSQDKYLYTRDGMIFVYLRIHAISIDLFSKSEKNVLIKTLTAELSDIQYPFKFLALSRPVDISPLITEMGDMLKEAEEKRKEILRQEILQMGSYALSGEIVERQFYIAIWDKQDEGSERDMLKKASLLCEKFAGRGVVTDILDKKRNRKAGQSCQQPILYPFRGCRDQCKYSNIERSDVAHAKRTDRRQIPVNSAL